MDKREDRDDIFKPFAKIIQKTRAINVGSGMRTKRTPNPVATPLPPSNHRKGLKQCPTTLNTPIIQRVDSSTPNVLQIG